MAMPALAENPIRDEDERHWRTLVALDNRIAELSAQLSRAASEIRALTQHLTPELVRERQRMQRQSDLDLRRNKIHGPKIEKLLNAVADLYGIEKSEIMRPRQFNPYLTARQVALYLMRERLGLPFSTIAARVGMHHTSVMYAHGRIAARMETDAKLRADVESIA